MKQKRLCFIQAHYTDLVTGSKDLFRQTITKVQRDNLFDRIVIGAANIPENSVLVDFALKAKINYCLGAIYNLAERMLKVCQEEKTEIIARILPQWYFVDLKLISSMMDYLEYKRADYVYLPHNFDIKFGADVLSFKLLLKTLKIFHRDKKIKEKFQFRPWYFWETEKNLFDSFVFKNIPKYSKAKLLKIKNSMQDKWPESWSYGNTFPYSDYLFAAKYLKNDDNALDIACGTGDGTIILSKFCKKIVGVDINKKSIAIAQSKVKNNEKISFITANALNLKFDNSSFDKIVSLHTIEHIIDDEAFIHELKKLTKTKGLLIIETPLRLKYPFLLGTKPFIPSHIREYTQDSFVKLISKYFKKIKVFGVNRGIYCPIRKTREAIMIIAG